MKVGLVYTSTTPELIELMEREIRAQLGERAEIFSLSDPSILADVRAAGYVTAKPAARLIAMYMRAVEEGCDAILNACSSVGEAADSAQYIARYIGVPIVRIDEEMCREAARLGSNIAVMATLETTLAPTKNTILRLAREMGKRVKLIDCLVEGAFGLDRAQFLRLMASSAGEVAGRAEVILLAQGSMAYCEDALHKAYKLPVLSSPRFGAIALKEALVRKGVIQCVK